MRNATAIVCLFVLFCGACYGQDSSNSDCNSFNAEDPSTIGDCVANLLFGASTSLCYDQCMPNRIIPQEDCANYDYCCLNASGNCTRKATVLRVAIVVDSSADVDFFRTNATNSAQAAGTSSNQGSNGGSDGGSDEDGARNFNIGGGLGGGLGGGVPLPPNIPFPPNIPGGQSSYLFQNPNQFCRPTYPQNCQIGYGGSALEAPFNIPYCQRIACDPNDPSLETDKRRCLVKPGCYYDDQLAIYRRYSRQGVLGGVPVCHLVIRNRAFQRRASELGTQLGGYNPLYASCILNEYRNEIFGPHAGCEMIDILQHFGHYPKRAGWNGINERQCALIGACSKRSPTLGTYCAYPMNSQGQVMLRAGTQPNSQFSSIYGLPDCFPLNAQLQPANYLSAYHNCLSAGCASSVDPNTLIQYLLQQSSNLNPLFAFRYRSMVLNGEIRADNYKKFLADAGQSNLNAQLFQSFGSSSQGPSRDCESSFYSTSQPNFPPSFPSGSNFGTGTSSGQNIPNIIPNSFNIGSGRNFPFPGNPFQPNPNRVPPCPFVAPNPTLYPGFPRLTGSFQGCCNRPLCYIPRPDLYTPYSGVSPYLSQWNCWSRCDVPCGRGLQNRTRGCVGGSECGSSRTSRFEQRACNTPDCPFWSTWGGYGGCSQTCGAGGIRVRSRTCSIENGCQGSATERLPCNTGRCPTLSSGPPGNCILNQGEEGCGSGMRFRTVTCDDPGDYGCPGGSTTSTQSEPCSIQCVGFIRCNRNTCCLDCYDGYSNRPIPNYNCKQDPRYVDVFVRGQGCGLNVRFFTCINPNDANNCSP